MKQYTTPLISVRLDGQGLALEAADRVVMAAKSQGGSVTTWEGERLHVDGDSVRVRLTEQETADLEGTSDVEVTVFIGDKVYKTETQRMNIKKAVWSNGD